MQESSDTELMVGGDEEDTLHGDYLSSGPELDLMSKTKTIITAVRSAITLTTWPETVEKEVSVISESKLSMESDSSLSMVDSALQTGVSIDGKSDFLSDSIKSISENEQDLDLTCSDQSNYSDGTVSLDHEIQIEMDNNISQLERNSIPEFFRTSGRKYKVKTPERYLIIRNGIINLWREKYAPYGRYMNKLACRKALLDGIKGDSGCFSRVHAFLESVGAINQGLSRQKAKGKPLSKRKRRFLLDLEEEYELNGWLSHRSARKRKIRTPSGWMEEHASWTISHQTENEPKKKNAQRKQKSSSFSQEEYDQFTLIPLLDFPILSSALNCPLNVTISNAAMVMMRVHTLTSSSEIIGLLGGTISCSEKEAIDSVHAVLNLYISMAIPCTTSASSAIECDMDPVSEMQAAEQMAQSGLTILGWYHSHPDFEPNPSIRDIETQSSYQSMFSFSQTQIHSCAQRIDPFVGFIVSPPDLVECFYVGEGVNHQMTCRQPYRLPYSVRHGPIDRDALKELLSPETDLDSLLLGMPPLNKTYM